MGPRLGHSCRQSLCCCTTGCYQPTWPCQSLWRLPLSTRPCRSSVPRHCARAPCLVRPCMCQCTFRIPSMMFIELPGSHCDRAACCKADRHNLRCGSTASCTSVIRHIREDIRLQVRDWSSPRLTHVCNQARPQDPCLLKTLDQGHATEVQVMGRRSWPICGSCLNSTDASLGPWGVGRDPLHAALLVFRGAPGGPLPAPWTPGGSSGAAAWSAEPGITEL